MFLSIATEGPGAEDLSYILQKAPGKIISRNNSKSFYPVYEPERANWVMYTEFPEYKLWNADTPDADAYVTSREYALSSLFCRELKHMCNTAISGIYKMEDDGVKAVKEREWIIEALPIVTSVPEKTILELIRPLGYRPIEAIGNEIVRSKTYVIDHSFQYPWMPQKTRVIGLTLRTKKTLSQLLRELLIIIPVLDNYTHVSELEPLVPELEKFGSGWLENHPLKNWIRARFLRYSNKLIRKFDAEIEPEKKKGPAEEELEKHIDLATLRRQWFVEQIKKFNARTVVDAGCGSGRLAEDFIKAGVFEVSAFDCSPKAVSLAMRFLKGKVNVYHGSLLYCDERLINKDAICLQEVIEHMGPWQLRKSMETIFQFAKPKIALFTSPNRLYNSIWGIQDGAFRHADHRFEFDSTEARNFAKQISSEFGYSFDVVGVGNSYVPPPPREEGTVAVAPAVGISPTFGFIFIRQDAENTHLGPC